jgi:hypothetical protein
VPGEAAYWAAYLSSSLDWSCCCCWNVGRFCSGAVTFANRNQACAIWDGIIRASWSPNVRAIADRATEACYNPSIA